MESSKRLIFKAISWQLLGLVTMGAISLYYTGSVMSAFSLTLTSTVCGLLFYFLHEKVWQQITWGVVGK